MPQARISDRAHRVLARLRRETGRTSEQIIDGALELLERDRLLAAINAGYQALRDDPEGWAEAVAERDAWDATMLDGLDR